MSNGHHCATALWIPSVRASYPSPLMPWSHALRPCVDVDVFTYVCAFQVLLETGGEECNVCC